MSRLPRRYLLVRIVSEQAVSEEQFSDAFMSAVRMNFGEIGFARIDPKLVRFDAGRLLAVVACKASTVSELEAAVALISGYSGVAAATLVLRVSGTIKGLRARLAKQRRS